MDSKLQKKFPDCANEALILIRSNYNRVSKQELMHLAYEFIFFYEFKNDQKTWVKKANPMQELQCADCIMNFLETEKEAHIRDYVFDLLFDDIHQISTKYILQLLLSYSLSLEARHTLECISKWLIMNIGNEIIQNIFDQLITDHFLLVSDKENPQNLINLAVISPLFSSIFMTIVLDMLPNNLISNHEKCMKKLFSLFAAWIEKNPMIPVIAFKANLSHSMQNIFNPLPGLFYISVLYPFKTSIDCLQKHVTTEKTCLAKHEKQKILCTKKFQNINDVITNVQLMTLKLLKDIHNILETTKLFPPDTFKLLTLKFLESMTKRFEDLNQVYENISSRSSGKSEVNCYHTVSSVSLIKEEALDRLAEVLELCLQYKFTNCKKDEFRHLFSSKCFGCSDSDEIESLLGMVLRS